MKLSHTVAVMLSRIAADRADAIGVPMVIALSDGQGELIHFSRMDGALPASSTIAVNKAYTAAALRMATHEVGQLSQPGESLYGIQHTMEGRAVLFGGGYPLRVGDGVAGAVGVSGGTVAQDMAVAQPVLAIWEQMLAVAQALAPIVSDAVAAHPKGRERLLEALTNAMSKGFLALPVNWKIILAGALWLV